MPPKLKLSEYELKRIKNLEDNQAVLAKLMEDLKHMEGASFTPPIKQKAAPKAKRRESHTGVVQRRSSSRFNSMRSPPTTRSRSRRGSLSSDASSASGGSSPDGHLVVKFGMFGKRKRNFDDDDDFFDDEEDHRPTPPRRPKNTEPRVIPSVDEITDQDIEAVAEHTSEKTYDQVYGTTCHQCRQKTIDQKTICRSEECYTIRGMFCGPCLRNRYGENVKEVLRDPDWSCPPCRGICNCSICRNRSRRGATGILIHLAREMGYDNVNAYLQSLSGKRTKAEKTEDEENEMPELPKMKECYVKLEKAEDENEVLKESNDIKIKKEVDGKGPIVLGTVTECYVKINKL